MKLLQVYNQYRSPFNGEEAVVQRTEQLAVKNGWETRLMLRTSRGLDQHLRGKLHAFWNGIYSRRAQRDMHAMLTDFQPDVVHTHNLYPLFSPSVLVACRQRKVPVVMTIHNHALTCPRADHLNRGKLCERCMHGREHQCVLNNCRGNIFESIAYATRSAYARRKQLFQTNLTLVIALTEFARQRLLGIGFAADQVHVLPNLFCDPQPPAAVEQNAYVAFAGRMSPEKGVDCLLEAARLVPEIPFHLAGDGPMRASWQRQAPPNCTFVGQMPREEMPHFYRRARFVVLPSRCYEMCPLVISEAMSQGVPVVASRIGGLAELIRDQENGLLFEPGNGPELADRIRELWHQPPRCKRLGQAAWHWAESSFGEQNYWNRLVAIYAQAMQRTGKRLANEADSAQASEPALQTN